PRAGSGERPMKFLLIIGSGVAAVGLFLLATASGDTAFFAQQYPLLLGLNAALAVLFGALVIYQLAALARRYRARVFGTRLTWRLLLRFAALAVLPGLIVYAVSVQFITRSIESWFDVKVDAALEGGMNLGQQAIDQMLLDLQAKARAMALEIGDVPSAQLVTTLERLRLQAGVREALLLSGRGRLLAAASEDTTKLVPELPAPPLLRQARAQRGHVAIDAQPGKPLSLRAIVPIEPLAPLAQAMPAVARGDFSRHAPVTSRDELGVLTESFNSMTRQLEEARRVLEANRTALEAAKARLENILANLSAGVLVFGQDLA